MYYILTTGPKGFIKVLDNEEIIISPDPNKATQFQTVGSAMESAVKINSALGTHSVKFLTIG